jgi:hypothetical protein
MHGWAAVMIGVTQLQMHHECADSYRADGMLPSATFTPRNDSLRERIFRAMESTISTNRRFYPEGKLWFRAPPEGRALNFH